MENNVCEFTPQEKRQICIGEEDKAIIASSCKWAKFLAIIGFVMIGLMVLLFLIMLLGAAVAGMTIPGMAIPGMGAGGAVAMTVSLTIGLVILLIYFFPLFYLYRYASRGLKAVETSDGVIMTESFMNLKRYFKFMGIFTIAVLVFYLLFLLLSIPMYFMTI